MSDNKINLVIEYLSTRWQFFPCNCHFLDQWISLHFWSPQQFKCVQSVYIRQDHTFTCLEKDKWRICDVEVWQGLDVEAATIVADHFLQLFYVFCGPIDYVVSRLVIVTSHKQIFGHLADWKSLTIIEEGKRGSCSARRRLLNYNEVALHAIPLYEADTWHCTNRKVSPCSLADWVECLYCGA